MMNQDSLVYWKVFMSKIASIISNDNLITKTSPSSRSIKCLVQVAIESKRVNSNLSIQLAVFKPLFERWDLN